MRFGESLTVEWEFGRDAYEATLAGAKIHRTTIDHVYAMNVVDETVWLYFYNRFAIARIQDDEIRLWDTDVDGAGVLLIAGSRIALVSGYGPDYDRFVIGHLDETDLVRDVTKRLVLPDGSDLPPTRRLFGRGPTVHAIAENRWYRLTLEQDQSR